MNHDSAERPTEQINRLLYRLPVWVQQVLGLVVTCHARSTKVYRVDTRLALLDPNR